MKNKLLIISSISPLKIDSGGAVRIFNTIKYLSAYCDIHLVYFNPPDYHPNRRDNLYLKKYTKSFAAINMKEGKVPNSFVADFQPYWFSDWYCEELKILIPKLIRKEDIKVVQVDCTQLLYLLPFLPNSVGKIFVAYDVSTVSFWRRLQELPFSFIKIGHFFKFIEIYLYERKYLRLFDLVVAMSKVDSDYMRNKFSLKNTTIVPNGLDRIVFKINKTSSKRGKIRMGYIGSFSHSPNRTAVEYIVNSVVPRLKKENIDFEFRLAGNNKPEDAKALLKKVPGKSRSSIKFLGFVDNIEDFYRNIDILVAPIFSGSGTRIKILESLSYGVPVVTTKIGAEGLENINHSYLSVTDKGQNYCDDLVIVIKKLEILGDKEERKSLRAAINEYTWENIMSKYSDILSKYWKSG